MRGIPGLNPSAAYGGSDVIPEDDNEWTHDSHA